MRKSIKDDEIYVPIRAEICDAYIVAGKPKPERNWIAAKCSRQTPSAFDNLIWPRLDTHNWPH